MMPVAKHSLRHGGPAFAVIPNSTVSDLADADAIAVLTYLLTKPSDWTIRKTDIKASLGMGDVRYRNANKLLREKGYMWTEEVRGDKGRIIDRMIWIGATPKCKEPYNMDPPKCKESYKMDYPHYGEPTPLQKKEVLQKKDASGRFTPPTVEEVSEYCASRGNSVNPQKFVDHYETNGWMRGKNKVKDWKACVRTWESNESKSAEVSYW